MDVHKNAGNLDSVDIHIDGAFELSKQVADAVSALVDMFQSICDSISYSRDRY